MAQPTISEAGQILYDQMPQLWRDQDEALGWPLLRYVEGFGLNIDEVLQIVKDVRVDEQRTIDLPFGSNVLLNPSFEKDQSWAVSTTSWSESYRTIFPGFARYGNTYLEAFNPVSTTAGACWIGYDPLYPNHCPDTQAVKKGDHVHLRVSSKMLDNGSASSWTLRVYARFVDANGLLSAVIAPDLGGAYQVITPTVGPNNWYDLEGLWTAPFDGWVFVYAYTSLAAPTTSSLVGHDAAQIVINGNADKRPPYGDGSFANWRWRGDDHASPSIPLITYTKRGVTQPGYAMLLDPDQAPDREDALRWLAQFVGDRPTKGLDISAYRGSVRSVKGLRRGGPDALLDEVEQLLDPNDTQKAMLIERYSGDAWLAKVGIYNFFNLIKNPRFAVDAATWATTATAGYVDYGDGGRLPLPKEAGSSDFAWRVHKNSPDAASRTDGIVHGTTAASESDIEPSTVYTTIAEFYVVQMVAGMQVRTDRFEYLADGTTLVLSTSGALKPAQLGWNRIAEVWTSQPTSENVRINPEVRTLAIGDYDAYITRVMLVKGDWTTRLPVFFDGDSVNSEWDGTRLASRSKKVSQAAMDAAIKRQKPMGMMITGVSLVVPNSFDDVAFNYDTFNDITNTGMTFAQFTADPIP